MQLQAARVIAGRARVAVLVPVLLLLLQVLVGLLAADQLAVGVQRASVGRDVLPLQGRPPHLQRQTAEKMPRGRALLLVVGEPPVGGRGLVPQAPLLLVAPPRLLAVLPVALPLLLAVLSLALLVAAR